MKLPKLLEKLKKKRKEIPKLLLLRIVRIQLTIIHLCKNALNRESMDSYPSLAHKINYKNY